MQAVLSFPSLTYALAAQRALSAAAIKSELVRLDAHDTPNGCANGLRLDRRYLEAAAALLDRKQIKFGRLP